MKSVITFMKISFITFSLTVILGIVPTQQRVFADEGGCSATPCQPGVVYGCNDCTTSGCNGCYKPNGAEGCGSCSKGANELDAVQVDTSWFNFKRYNKIK